MKLASSITGLFQKQASRADATGFRDIRINIFQEGYRTKAQRPTILVVLAFLVVASLAGLFTMYQNYADTSGDTDGLKTQIEQLNVQTQQAQEASSAVESRVNQAQSQLDNLQAARDVIRGTEDRSVVATIELLTTGIPYPPQISSIKLETQQIVLTGQAIDPKTLITYARALADRPQFLEASITSVEAIAQAGNVESVGPQARHGTVTVTETVATTASGSTPTGSEAPPSLVSPIIDPNEADDDDPTTHTSDSITFNFGTPPAAAFTSMVMTPWDPVKKTVRLQFIDTSTPGDDPIVKWLWDFGDGSTSSKKDTYHDYTSEGTYTVTLTVTDSMGRRGTSTGGSMFQKVTASFTASLPSCANPLTIAFKDTSSTTGKLDTWAWDFDDDGMTDSTQQNPKYTFPGAGEYTVSLTVEGTLRTPATVKNLIRASTPPDAAFSVTPLPGDNPLSLQFVDESTSSDTLIQWQWEFGDGRTSTERNPTHSYTKSGPYTVSFRVVENDGNCDTIVKTIQMANSGLAVSFLASPVPGGEPLAVQFSDRTEVSDAEETVWYWEFGDGESSHDANPIHEYDKAGTYTVTFRIGAVTSKPNDPEVRMEVASATQTITISESTATPFTMSITKRPSQ